MPVNWNQGKYLFASSGLFAIPAVYSYFRGFIIYPYLNSSIALSSMIFWSNPNSYIGRNINDIVIHIGCIYYIVDGCRNLTEEGTVVIFPGNLKHHVPTNNCDGRIVFAGNIYAMFYRDKRSGDTFIK